MASSTEPEPRDDDPSEVKAELRAPTTAEAQDLDRARRTDRTNKILVDADRRDDDATARDAVSDERERLADRRAFLDPGADYAGNGARRAAALDRADAKSDREYSAADRAQLTEGEGDDADVMGP
jgi:hypothetical protein